MIGKPLTGTASEEATSLDMAFHVHIFTKDPNHMNVGWSKTVKHNMMANMELPIPLANVITGYSNLGIFKNAVHPFFEFVVVCICLALAPVFE